VDFYAARTSQIARHRFQGTVSRLALEFISPEYTQIAIIEQKNRGALYKL
jgi:hypothetical protein